MPLAQTLIASSTGANFLSDLAIVLCVAALTSIGFRLLKQPPLLGYLLAGLVIGPHTPLPIFADSERVHAMSEFGVVLVMFSVGLEFSLARFMRVLPRSGLLALVEISAMAWIGHALGSMLGWSGVESLFLGGALAISSTMVVSKVFEAQPPEPGLRELVFGTLVIQDVVAIALLAVLTAIATGLGVSAEALGRTVLELGLFLVALLLGGLLLVPRLVRLIERIGSPETRVVTAGGLCFGLALLAQSFGYSIALGAFVAGMLVAESGKGHDIDHLLQPVRDLFVAVFFVSVGMSVDPRLVWANIGVTVAVFLIVVFGQLLSVTLGGLLGGTSLRRALAAGIALGQVGEFAFIMAGVGTAAGVVDERLSAILVAVAIATSFTTPFLVRRSDPIIAWIDHRLPQSVRRLLSLYEAWAEELRERGPGDRSLFRRTLTVLAFDALGLIALAVGGHLLHDRAIELGTSGLGLEPTFAKLGYQALVIVASLPFVISMARTAGRLARLLGEQLLPGVRENRPDLANAPRRTMIVILQLGVILVVGAPVLAFTQPFIGGPWNALLIAVAMLALLPVLWRDTANLDGHLRAGAQVVLELLRQTTPATPDSADEHSAPHPSTSSVELDSAMATLLPGLGHVEGVTISARSPALGRSLAELDLHARTGAVVLAIARGGENIIDPDLQTRIEAGDVLALLGAREAVLEARACLEHAALAEPNCP